MAMYTMLHHTHVSCAVLSILLFGARWFWVQSGRPRPSSRLVRYGPHLVDTVFLTSAILLLFQIDQYPFVHPWLTAKFFGLTTYIILGSLAIRTEPGQPARVPAFIVAVFVYGYVVSVALTTHPLGWLAVL